MKNSFKILGIALVALSLSACTNNTGKAKENQSTKNETKSEFTYNKIETMNHDYRLEISEPFEAFPDDLAFPYDSGDSLETFIKENPDKAKYATKTIIFVVKSGNKKNDEKYENKIVETALKNKKELEKKLGEENVFIYKGSLPSKDKKNDRISRASLLISFFQTPQPYYIEEIKKDASYVPEDHLNLPIELDECVASDYPTAYYINVYRCNPEKVDTGARLAFPFYLIEKQSPENNSIDKIDTNSYVNKVVEKYPYRSYIIKL